MGRLTVGLFLAIGIVMGVGCQHPRLGGQMQVPGATGACETCPPGGGGVAGGAYSGRGQGIPADVMGTGATPTVNYPYYTLRGPRDFLAKNPPSIGP